MNRNCANCNKEIYRKLSEVRRRYFCSKECYWKSGFDNEHKTKLSQRKIENPNMYWKGKKRPEMIGNKITLGYHHTEESKKKIADTHRGSNHYLWKGGISRNREYRTIIESIRRGRKVNNGGRFSYEEWRILKEKYNNMCLSCLKSEPEIKLTIDHIIPISKGGSSSIDNIQPLCLTCNCKKSNKKIDFTGAYLQ